MGFEPTFHLAAGPRLGGRKQDSGQGAPASAGRRCSHGCRAPGACGSCPARPFFTKRRKSSAARRAGLVRRGIA